MWFRVPGEAWRPVSREYAFLYLLAFNEPHASVMSAEGAQLAVLGDDPRDYLLEVTPF